VRTAAGRVAQRVPLAREGLMVWQVRVA
jgi:hypothetical protein